MPTDSFRFIPPDKVDDMAFRLFSNCRALTIRSVSALTR